MPLSTDENAIMNDEATCEGSNNIVEHSPYRVEFDAGLSTTQCQRKPKVLCSRNVSIKARTRNAYYTAFKTVEVSLEHSLVSARLTFKV